VSHRWHACHMPSVPSHILSPHQNCVWQKYLLKISLYKYLHITKGINYLHKEIGDRMEFMKINFGWVEVLSLDLTVLVVAVGSWAFHSWKSQMQPYLSICQCVCLSKIGTCCVPSYYYKCVPCCSPIHPFFVIT